MIPMQDTNNQVVPLQNVQQQQANYEYQQKLQKIQSQQQATVLSKVQFDVPQNWTSETTYLKFTESFLCYGKSTTFVETQSFGRIEIYREKGCKLACFNPKSCCLCYEHSEIPYMFQNLPSEGCPIQIEMCCKKTAMIRYKGVILGKVEHLISGSCASTPRFIVKHADQTRPPMVLQPVVSCANRLDVILNYACKFPKKIDVVRDGIPITQIINSHVANSMCTMPWNEQNAFYAKGDITFESSMKDDEKILLVCGWIIQQAFMSKLL
ncbi:hypothetical protein TTHERM_00861590 (macronuclear) [Tetrahymena thermophila SB210]|uniref:Uncharacterized protein n=1 Tax=Tetrahymena thermophila (strain SB210) TaxID=312017 RepID=Q23JS8_TETTS|nr:hypothetical protein TTHERM_00861570 [Tetrahymena thermophila SB210]XP_001017027.1 hypothetical protein TTHERM_00861590 [Tetrahymena thermophila SB210]EAR96780.1 hypothetical protein TTHERM_00861570 [Tetrahymena thermophila SB210]EAR96782.1 hypothetical protein TTHERM_00861590 [Tetrahymena thermophila SB210]|eukprot:XP_001017025.1 hypothetical protein TTHERM_00861570 [Tetrahymena thermophila SB210]